MARSKTTNGKFSSVTAILIDPDSQSITEVQVGVDWLYDEIRTNAVKNDDFYRLLDCSGFGVFLMPPIGADICVHNTAGGLMRAEGDRPLNSFRFDETCDPIAGKVLLIGFHLRSHTYKDVSFPIASLRETVIWSRYAAIGDRTAATENDVVLEN